MTEHSLPSDSTHAQMRYAKALARTARTRPALWIVPICAALLIGTLIAFLGPKKWDATQAFFVREELIGRIVGPGRFDSLDTMKTAQETIQEISKRPGVLHRMLKQIGHDSNRPLSADWPSDEDIESIQGAISFYAPGGAEVGKTEVLILKIVASSRERAKMMAQTLFDEAQAELRRVRTNRALSMEKEVTVAANLAQQRLATSAKAVSKIEAQVGSDLSELRSLNDSLSGTSEIRRMDSKIQEELRAAQTELESNIKQQETLAAALNDPSILVATPKELLNLQPSLAHLKNKLLDAQAEQATVRGRYKDVHPTAEAAGLVVEDMRNQITRELSNAQRGLETQISLAQMKIDGLLKRSDQLNQRLGKLAGLRVYYSQAVDTMRRCEEDLQQTQQELGQAMAIRQVADTVDLITRVDDAQASTQPVGPSKKTLLAGCLLAGLTMGLGLIVIITPNDEPLPPLNLRTPQMDPAQVSETTQPPVEAADSNMGSNVAFATPTLALPDTPAFPDTTQASENPVSDFELRLSQSPFFVLPDITTDMSGPATDPKES